MLRYLPAISSNQREPLRRLIVHNEVLLANPARGLGGGVRGRGEYPPCQPCFGFYGLDASHPYVRPKRAKTKKVYQVRSLWAV